jgi:hypothetical protein
VRGERRTSAVPVAAAAAARLHAKRLGLRRRARACNHVTNLRSNGVVPREQSCALVSAPRSLGRRRLASPARAAPAAAPAAAAAAAGGKVVAPAEGCDGDVVERCA